MDQKPPNSHVPGRMHQPRSSEPTPEVEAEIRACLTPGARVDVSESMVDLPSNNSLAGYGARHPPRTSRAQNRYTAFNPGNILPLDVQRASFTPSPPHSWDERPKATLREHLNNLLKPFADALKPADEVALHEWLRAAIWWALRGNLALEPTEISSKKDDEQLSSKKVMQGLMDLAKAWWICYQVLAQDDFKLRMASSSIRGAPNSALFDQYRTILTYLRQYEGQIAAILCRETDFAETLDVDKRLWVLYPPCTAYEAAILNDNNQGQAWNLNLPPMTFGDTSDVFCYKSVFVDVTIVAQEEYSLPTSSTFQCVFSIVRDPRSWQTVGILASQTHLVHLEIHSNRDQGQYPVWKDIKWDIAQHSMLIKLRHPGCSIKVRLDEDNFKAIWELIHQMILSDDGLVAGEDEDVIFDETVKFCQYINHDKPVGFPARPTAHCRVRLLKKTVTENYGAVQRKAHRGLRLVVVTPPQIKVLHQVSHDLQNSCPVSYSLVDGDDGSPGLRLHLLKDDDKCSLSIYFDDSAARSLLLSLIQDLISFPGETDLKTFFISSYAISQQLSCQEPGTQETQSLRLELGESLASVIEQDSESELGRAPFGKAVLSEHLRVIVETKWGTITDRFNMGPGMLRITLPVQDNTLIHLHRLPQKDLSMTVSQDLVSQGLFARLKCLLPATQVKPSTRMIKFKSQDDLHKFQEAVTGFKVLFDSMSTRFLITRRRRLLPLLKQWDTNIARVQVIQQGNKVQIVAFFHNFRRWKCLNFQVTALDEFESVEQKGEWGVRVNDAKYALPQPESGCEPDVPDSVCLDELEYPTEHDDIAVMFGDEMG